MNSTNEIKLRQLGKTDILVTPVTRATDDDAAALSRQAFDGLHQRRHGIWIVSVVGNHGGAPVLEHVEAARRVVAVVGER